MNPHYLTVKQTGQHTIEIKKSRFICLLTRVTDESQAKAFIQTVKKEHWKASHHCSAFIIGDQLAIQRSSDDGEPAGTAGIPMLEVLKRRGLINTLAVVIRYFGGTELGKGGLVRAYSGVVAEALDVVGIVEGRLQQEVFIQIDYPNHSRLETFLSQSPYDVKETLFTDNVTVSCMIDSEMIQDFETEITNLLHGNAQFKLGNQAYFEKDYPSEK